MPAYSLPHLYTIGNHYETGLIIGTEFKNRIIKFIQDFSEFHNQILPFINGSRGKKIIENYLSLIENKYPWYVDEMKGMSHGSGISFDWILALNFRVELFHIINSGENAATLQQDKSTKECSDFILIDKENNFLVHNEDSVASVYETCYIVSCKINSSIYNGVKAPTEEFTCYCYPGHLAGNAFGFNSNGFCFGVNALYPKEILFDRFPRQIINRIMMSAKSLEELEDIFLKTPISYGVCLNIGYFGDNKDLIKSNWIAKEIEDKKMAWNYEIAPNKENECENKLSKHCIIEPVLNDALISNNETYTQRYYYHFNHYERFKIEECYNASSQNRKKRADQISHPLNETDLLDIASDNQNVNHPIYRVLNKDDPEELKTIATAIFDFTKNTMSVYTERPKYSKPLIVIQLK